VCRHTVDDEGLCTIAADPQLDTVRPGEVLFQVTIDQGQSETEREKMRGRLPGDI
jgi:hypothetical protein